ncbi:MAG: heme A synthase [Synechococcaceae cyanobacterium RL_1_2]|nr:heme A synthase [Synechococcaceae cyanobacterium RL_1_2]
MTESFLNISSRQKKFNFAINKQKLIQGLVWKIAIATVALMAVGSATRVMNAGLACPDWPLCYGQFIPNQYWNLQVFLEWFHRLDAGLIGLSTLALVLLSWWFRRDLPQWLPWAALTSLGLIVFQAVLGGLTVTKLLRFDIVTAHLGTAFLFLGSLIIIGCSLIPHTSYGTGKKLPWWGAISTVLVYGQCLLGGLVGSRWALHQCFNGYELCAVMNSHLIGVVPSTIATFITVVAALRTPALHPHLRKISQGIGLLLGAQLALGLMTFRLHLQVEPLTVIHHAVGALLFACLLAFSTIALRDQKLASI